MRAYKIMMTPPMAPVLQPSPTENCKRARYPTTPNFTFRSSHILRRRRAILVPWRKRHACWSQQKIRSFYWNALRARPMDWKYTVELAETLQAPVIDLAARMNFPSQHPLNQTERTRAVIGGADVILGLEAVNFWGTINSYRDQVHRSSEPITKKDVKLISISASDLYMKSNYQDFQRYTELDLAMAADAEATLPSLIEAVKRLLTDDMPEDI